MAQSLDNALFEGPHCLHAQVQKAWMQHIAPPDSPWQLRVSTKQGAASWVRRFATSYDTEQVQGATASRVCCEDIKQSVIDALGPMPACLLRVQLYVKGHSATPEVRIDFRIEPEFETQGYDPSAFDVGTALAMIQQYHAAMIGMAAQVGSSNAGMQQLVAVQSQTIAQLGAMRSVTSASADTSSIGSMVSMGALALLWPHLSKQLGLNETGDNTPMFLRVLKLRDRILGGATSQEQATLGMEPSIEDVPMLEDFAGDFELDDAPTFEPMADVVEVDTTNTSSEADLIIQAAKDNPALMDELASRILADPVLMQHVAAQL